MLNLQDPIKDYLQGPRNIMIMIIKDLARPQHLLYELLCYLSPITTEETYHTSNTKVIWQYTLEYPDKKLEA